MKTNYKAGDILPNGEIYLGRIDDEIWTVNNSPIPELPWQEAKDHAESLGMELLDEVAGMLIFKKRSEGALKELLEDKYALWLSVPDGVDGARVQGLGSGRQGYGDRGGHYSSCPVRRLSIQSFNNLFSGAYS